MAATLGAWFAGGCAPLDPGGVGTYGFVVRDGESLLVRQHGRVPDVPGLAMDALLADYASFVLLLDWLAAQGLDRPVRIEGDGKAVIMQVRDEWPADAGHQALRKRCQTGLAALPQGSRLVHIGRDRNAEAQALARLAYVEAFQSDAALAARFEAHLASPYQLEQLRKSGRRGYAFMPAAEAERALRRPRA